MIQLSDIQNREIDHVEKLWWPLTLWNINCISGFVVKVFLTQESPTDDGFVGESDDIFAAYLYIEFAFRKDFFVEDKMSFL